MLLSDWKRLVVLKVESVASASDEVRKDRKAATLTEVRREETPAYMCIMAHWESVRYDALYSLGHVHDQQIRGN